MNFHLLSDASASLKPGTWINGRRSLEKEEFRSWSQRQADPVDVLCTFMQSIHFLQLLTALLATNMHGILELPSYMFHLSHLDVHPGGFSFVPASVAYSSNPS
ncbi:hypothetical protein [Halobacillus litoralis]|uniref:hypothetical protein n=1 Tax=Halobacillus litoralis TaxID=45668 RepID=UPI000FFC1EDA|nr:hypothetical protein [Halobacillus litoralis]